MGKFYEGLYEALSTYVRYCAWLNAVPKDGNPAPKTMGMVVKPESRAEAWKRKGIEPRMPPIDAEYLIGYLWEAGPTMPGAAGAVPLTQTELRAWQENIGIELQPWEVRILRRLSCDWVAEMRRAEDPIAKPPYGELVRSPDLDDKVDAFLE